MVVKRPFMSQFHFDSDYNLSVSTWRSGTSICSLICGSCPWIVPCNVSILDCFFSRWRQTPHSISFIKYKFPFSWPTDELQCHFKFCLRSYSNSLWSGEPGVCWEKVKSENLGVLESYTSQMESSFPSSRRAWNQQSLFQASAQDPQVLLLRYRGLLSIYTVLQKFTQFGLFIL